MRRTIISSVEVDVGEAPHRLGRLRGSLPDSRRLAAASGRCPCARASSAVSSSVTGFSNAMSRAANHICLWPPSSSQPASSRACASNRPRSRCCDRGAGDASSKCRCRSPAMRVADHGAEALDGADARQRRDGRLATPCATGTSTARRSGTARATSRAARRGSRCRTARGATAATPRSRARGTACGARRRRRRSSKPPWQRTPPAIERLGDGIGREQLLLAPGQLEIGHAPAV